MNNKPREPVRGALRTLTSYEVQVRNLVVIEKELGPVLDAIEDRQPELVEKLRRSIAFCDPENLLESVIRLRSALQRTSS